MLLLSFQDLCAKEAILRVAMERVESPFMEKSSRMKILPSNIKGKFKFKVATAERTDDLEWFQLSKKHAQLAIHVCPIITVLGLSVWPTQVQIRMVVNVSLKAVTSLLLLEIR